MAVPRVRVVVRAIHLIAIVVALSVASTGAAEGYTTQASSVAIYAKRQLYEPWRYGANGPHAFDCSGLVYFAFKRAGLLYKIGGSRMGVRGYWSYFANKGKANRFNPRRGDLVVWGNGQHIGIYLDKGKAISTLVNGVRIHGIHDLYQSFTTFLHVKLER